MVQTIRLLTNSIKVAHEEHMDQPSHWPKRAVVTMQYVGREIDHLSILWNTNLHGIMNAVSSSTSFCSLCMLT